MVTKRAQFKVTAGPNAGDELSLDIGSCRLIGRHLSDTETQFIDRDGNRVLEPELASLLADQLQERSPQDAGGQGTDFSSTAFERGSDIVFSDDSISRAHAMLFFDDAGAGVIDLASTNGTYVNNRRINSTMVADKDVIGLGSSQLRVKVKA
jgi:hypothetical protein